MKKFIHLSAIGASNESKSKYQQSKHLGEEKSFNSFNEYSISVLLVCFLKSMMISILFLLILALG